jgi:hypothetical protein
MQKQPFMINDYRCFLITPRFLHSLFIEHKIELIGFILKACITSWMSLKFTTFTYQVTETKCHVNFFNVVN